MATAKTKKPGPALPAAPETAMVPAGQTAIPAIAQGTVIDLYLAGLAEKIQPVVATALALQVTDEATRATAIEKLVAIKGFLNEAEAKRKEWKEPVLEAGKLIDGSVKRTVEPASRAYDGLNARATAWVVKEDQRRERELADQRAREQEVQRQATIVAEEKGLPAPTVIPRASPPVVETHIQTGAGAGTLVKRWTFELIDTAALMGVVTDQIIAFAADPKNKRGDIVLLLRNTKGAAHPELFELDGQRTRSLVNAGARSVPGLRIYQSATTAVKA